MISRWVRWFGYLLLLGQILLGLHQNGLLSGINEQLRLAVIKAQDFSQRGSMIPR
jgi:hypothetical protein